MTVNNGEFEKEKRRRSGSSLQQGLHTYQDAISTSQFLERSLKGLRVAKADSITVFAVLRSVMVDSIVPTNSFPVLTLFLLHQNRRAKIVCVECYWYPTETIFEFKFSEAT